MSVIENSEGNQSLDHPIFNRMQELLQQLDEIKISSNQETIEEENNEEEERDEKELKRSKHLRELNAFYSNLYSLFKEDATHPVDAKLKNVHDKFKTLISKKFDDYKRRMVRIKRKQDTKIFKIKSDIEKDSTNKEIIQNLEQNEYLNYILYSGNEPETSEKLTEYDKQRIRKHFQQYQKTLFKYLQLFEGKFDLVLTEFEEDIYKLQSQYSLAISTQTQIKLRNISLAKTRVVEMLAGSDATKDEKDELFSKVLQDLN